MYKNYRQILCTKKMVNVNIGMLNSYEKFIL